MMLLAMAAAGGLIGAGLLLIIRGVVAPAAPLATVVADLHRPRHSVDGRPGWATAVLERLGAVKGDRRRVELAVCERTAAKFVQDRCLWALIGAAPGLALLPLTAAGQITVVTPGLCLAAIVAGAVGGWWYALVSLSAEAAKHRREFRHALAAYLELVTILMSGGAGVETALYDAASLGHGPAFRHIRTALSAAQARREAPWVTLGALGARLGVAELSELEASMALAGGGARVKDSLTAKATSMRSKDLAQLESEAHSRSETMVLPVAMMFAGFLLLIGFPALAGLGGP